ncbi:[FeFe] hydrogenase, group A [Thermosediminibacter litoriperuensis]|uniref:NAD(P)-dependent iron-only hydrogenase catalytic subunit n=1 Tax=Thermosediminibacter litoriperuensis TaxID=291989 RepID=A0A5S5AW50_9FIRM|nr:[FeFe] hydrogenase, group A [Thermosediminibacter litoriperuensis]TYP57569.1 NAD(P)-dependent iron-only hydrogenase catalytic subunit [Thermosediminibacter litoriperuensis]
MAIIEINQELCKGCTLCSQVCGVEACSGEPLIPHGIDERCCVNCGQCVVTCPAGAAKDRSDLERVKEVLEDDSIIKVVQSAPALRVSLGEEFGMEPGTIVPGRMASAFRKMGFDRVYDTCFAADLTVMEEGHEFLERMEKGGPFPMFTSCCPAWMLFMEKYYPDLLDHLSSCKSPQQMFGALVKAYMAEKEGIDPARIFMLSAMPCTAKKFEAARPEMNLSGARDVDAVLTTRELAQLIKDRQLELADLPEEDFDIPFGEYTGAGALFGASGGVMEAALRTVAKKLAGKPLKSSAFELLRKSEGFREAVIYIGNRKIKTAVVHGLKNIIPVLEEIKKGNSDYHFIEVMTCSDGCIGGGGQPRIPKRSLRQKTVRKRKEALYYYELGLPKIEAGDNPSIKAVYVEFLGSPLSEKSHELLHVVHSDNR